MRAEIQPIDIGQRALADYDKVAGEGTSERIAAVAGGAKGLRVLHLTGPGSGPRVNELLRSLLPLLRDCGLTADWAVLHAAPPFADVARVLLDGLQGGETALGAEDVEAWAAAGREAAGGVELASYDVVLLHDAAALAAAAGADARLVWRCHVDASQADRVAWSRLRPLADACSAWVFPVESFAPPGAAGTATHFVAPGIDPLGARLAELPVRLAGTVVRALGVDLTRPFCLQVARFDPWKDPQAVLDAYELAREEVRDLQLVLAGTAPAVSGENWDALGEVAEYAAASDDVHVLTSYTGVGNLEVNALLVLARATLQKSLREGFGLAASESLWKGTPVIGHPGGGLPLQVRDGREGYLASGADETAARLVELVRDPALSIELGRSGHDRVRERFLVTRMLEDELRMLRAVAQGAPANLGS
jgi:trehalose synthase